MTDVVKGKNVKIGKNVEITGGGHIRLGDNVTIRDDVKINVTEKLFIGDRSSLGKRFIIRGRDIEIGTELWSGHDCEIGGGSCFEKTSSLRIGYWCHLGNYSFINTARPVTIGNEVGLGIRTALYTHGAYQSILRGFPVEFGPITIEDNCWLPSATVLPNVHIGKNSVIGVGAVVTQDIPPGSLAVGVPTKVIKRNVYPREPSPEEKAITIKNLLSVFQEQTGEKVNYDPVSGVIMLREPRTTFDLEHLEIRGVANEKTERLRNHLRRHGIRFKYYPQEGRYVPW